MAGCYIKSAFSYTKPFVMVFNNLSCSIIKAFKHTLSSNEVFICFATIVATYIMNICTSTAICKNINTHPIYSYCNVPLILSNFQSQSLKLYNNKK